jgi:hypothetical protein
MRRLAPLAGLLGLAACASGPRVEVRHRSSGPIAARVAAVYPYAFRWEEPPFRVHEKSMDEVLFLVARDRLLVFGPGEFQVLRAGEPSPLAATDLVAVLTQRGLGSLDFLAFRGWAERRIAISLGQLEQSGKLVAVSSQDVTYVAHLEVADADGEVLVELQAEAEAGKAEDRPEYDPMPELTALHRRLLQAAWEEIEPRLTAPPLAPPPIEVRWLPASTLDYGGPAQATLKERMLAMEALEADMARSAVYRYYAPSLSDRQIGQEMRLPGGLYVLRARPPFAGQLEHGDVILQVEGEHAVGPQVLQRALAAPRDGPLHLRIARGPARLEVEVPAMAVPQRP